MLARIHAGWLLAFSLLITLVRRVIPPPLRGLALFQHNFAAERLLPMAAHERNELPTFSRCIACGRCDTSASLGALGGSYRGMMSFVLCASRSMPDFDMAVGALEGVDDAVLARLERECPVSIPFRQMVSFVRSKALLMKDV